MSKGSSRFLPITFETDSSFLIEQELNKITINIKEKNLIILISIYQLFY